MGLIDSLVPGLGAVAGLGESIYGGIKAGEERKRMDDYLRGQKADNETWYNQNYYGDYLQRADTQALMKRTRDMLKKNNEVAANTAVVTGATPEAQNAVKEQSNKVITDTATNLGAMWQRWKDNISNQYLNRKNQLSNAEYGNMADNATGYENLMSNGIRQIGAGVSGLGTSLMTNKNTPVTVAGTEQKYVPADTTVHAAPLITPSPYNSNVNTGTNWKPYQAPNFSSK